MQKNELLKSLAAINVWKQGSQRAPNKPLLLLMAFARCSRGEPRETPYKEIDKKLNELLREFGPPRKSYHPEYPFWRLQNDGIWVVSDSDKLALRTGNTDAKKSDLLRINPPGGLTPEIERALREDPALLAQATNQILHAHFSETLHGDILAAVGMQFNYPTIGQKSKRDPAFREKILRAYERRCAVCGFDLRLGNMDIALEAAHIMWHQAGGPDTEANGLALCALHHKLLDRGVFTVSNERLVLVSQDVSGSHGMNEHLLCFHGKPIRKPQSEGYLPSLEFLAWHRHEVFRGPER